MKRTAVENGVPSRLVTDLTRMAHIWNAVRRHAEEHMSPEVVDGLMTKINDLFMVEERSEHDISILLPDTITGLEVLKAQGYMLGLVTTASRWSYERLSNSDEFGRFGSFFTKSITRDDCRYIKPDPEPINRMKKLHNREDVVYVGDSDHDALAAHAAGCKFVLINTREYDQDAMNSFRPDGVISRLSELPGLLEVLAMGSHMG